MSNVIEPAATAATTVPPTATVTNPPAQQGATPIHPDTAHKIETLERDLGSANDRIKILNNENKNYRLLSDVVKNLGIEPESVKTQLETLQKYSELGTLEELKTKADRAGVADELEREKTETEVSGILGLKRNALFKQQLGQTQFEIEGEGDARKVFVKGEDGKRISFDDYVASRPELSDALPALQNSDSGQQQKPVIPVLRGAPVGGGKTLSLAEQIRAEEAAKKPKAPEGAPVDTLESRLHLV